MLWTWYFKSFRKGFWSNFRSTITFFLIVIFNIKIVFNNFHIVLMDKMTRLCLNSVNTGCGWYQRNWWCNSPELVIVVVENVIVAVVYVAVAAAAAAAVVALFDTVDDVATSWVTYVTLVVVGISCEGTRQPVPSPPSRSSRQGGESPTPLCCRRAPRTQRGLHYSRFPAP